MPPPTELLERPSAVPPIVPGVIVPTLVTAPITVEPEITIEVVTLPNAFETLGTLLMTLCPACAGALQGSATPSAMAETEAKTVPDTPAKSRPRRFPPKDFPPKDMLVLIAFFPSAPTALEGGD
jgi:hypothetical protein